VRLLSVRHEFPTEWARFSAATIDPQTPEAPLAFTLSERNYPLWATKVGPIELRGLGLFAEPRVGTKPIITVATAPTDDPVRAEHQLEVKDIGDLRAGTLGAPLPPAIGELILYINDNSMGDLWLVLLWGSQ
jgi:hypothetical protein